MKSSCYLKAIPPDGKSNRYLLFSQAKGSLIRVNAKCYESLLNGTLAPSEAAVLARLGMLVHDPEHEKRAMPGLLDRINARNTALHLIVVLNLDCNLACVYCYEEGMKGRHYMSRQTGERLTDFIEARLKEGKKDLRIDFYGGEPLLSVPRIKQIAKRAGACAKAAGATFSFSLVTNGSLLKRPLAEELVGLGLENARITLDGPAELHDRTRPYKAGGGSFAQIIANIQETWDLVRISIGGNYEKHTYKKFAPLLDYLGQAGLTPDRIAAIKFDPVMKLPESGIGLPDYKGGCVSLNEPWLIEADALLREEILKRGYRTQKVRPVTCMVDLKDSYVVHYNGSLYKCPAFIGRKGFEAGDLERGLSDYSTAYHLGHWKNAKCAECTYLPLCFGGCRYISFVREGKIGALDCRKAYLDAALETLVKQDAKYAAVFKKQGCKDPSAGR